MKRNYKSVTITAATLVFMALLSGCTELPGKAEQTKTAEQNFTETFAEDLGTAIKEGVGEAAAITEQSVQNAVTQVVDEVTADSIRKELTASGKIGSATVLSMNNAVGEVKVQSGSADTINVTATIVSHNRSANESDRQQILDNAEISIEINGDQVELSTHAKDSPDKDLWTWAQKKYGFSDFSINYVVEVPSFIDSYEIQNNVGQIHMSGLKGNYNVASDVGAIHIEKAVLSGKSTIESDTGSIQLDIADLTSGSSLTSTSQVGSITAALPDDLQYSLETSSELGQITGADKGTSDVNGGGPLITLSTQIGAIRVQ